MAGPVQGAMGPDPRIYGILTHIPPPLGLFNMQPQPQFGGAPTFAPGLAGVYQQMTATLMPQLRALQHQNVMSRLYGFRGHNGAPTYGDGGGSTGGGLTADRLSRHNRFHSPGFHDRQPYTFQHRPRYGSSVSASSSSDSSYYMDDERYEEDMFSDSMSSFSGSSGS